MFAAWIARGVLTLIGALCYAELASAYHSMAGDYEFLTRASDETSASFSVGARHGDLSRFDCLTRVCTWRLPHADSKLGIVFIRHIRGHFGLYSYCYQLCRAQTIGAHAKRADIV